MECPRCGYAQKIEVDALNWFCPSCQTNYRENKCAFYQFLTIPTIDEVSKITDKAYILTIDNRFFYFDQKEQKMLTEYKITKEQLDIINKLINLKPTLLGKISLIVDCLSYKQLYELNDLKKEVVVQPQLSGEPRPQKPKKFFAFIFQITAIILVVMVVVTLPVIAIPLAVYFLPIIVAISRSQANVAAIATLNILLGWTVIGWVIALTWAFTKPIQQININTTTMSPMNKYEELETIAKLKDKGIISEHEFLEKKMEMLRDRNTTPK